MGNAISFHEIYALIEAESAPISADMLFHDPETIFEDAETAGDAAAARPPLRGGIVPV